jgi:hypothetical protein
MTDPATTSQPGPEPADDPQAAAAVAQEATEGGAHLVTLAAKAKEARGPGYDGTLTAALLIELGELLRLPTPARYVKFIPPATGKPYPSIGLNSAQFQIDVMNAVLGRPHWRILRHYPAGKDGFMCKVVVLVGNRLAAASLDEHGELIAGDADILGVGQEWGAVKNATTPADAYKGSATNATKRAIAEFGPGADVYRKDFEDENVGGTGALHAPAAGAPIAQQGGQQPRAASTRQQSMLRARARAAGLDSAQFANLILRAAQQPQRRFDSPAHATEYVGRLLGALPAGLVDPVKEAIAGVQRQARAARQATDAASARAVAQGVVYTGASDIPTDVAPIAPVAVGQPNRNGAHPPAPAA